MAHAASLAWRDNDINSRFDEPEIILKWGCRSLYLSMFCVLISALNLWHLPFTLPYIGAILVLCFTGLSVVQNVEAWEELDDMYLEDISGYFLESL